MRLNEQAAPGPTMRLNLPKLEGDDSTSAAVTLLIEAFTMADDEGKFSLIRHAAMEYSGQPETAGRKLPRDWRALAIDLMHEYGWELSTKASWEF